MVSAGAGPQGRKWTEPAVGADLCVAVVAGACSECDMPVERSTRVAWCRKQALLNQRACGWLGGVVRLWRP